MTERNIKMGVPLWCDDTEVSNSIHNVIPMSLTPKFMPSNTVRGAQSKWSGAASHVQRLTFGAV